MTNTRVGVGVHYLSLARHPYYVGRFGWRPSDFPAADTYGNSTVSLPLSPKLSDSEVDYIVETVIGTIAA